MASFQAVKKAVNLAPTVRALPNGVPVAPLLNLAVRAPSSGHDHAHNASGPRADVQPRWAGGASRTPSGLVSRTFTNGECQFFFAPQSIQNAKY
jgi:ubiquinol-cytochrome c reductase iron-sulfur subunit